MSKRKTNRPDAKRASRKQTVEVFDVLDLAAEQRKCERLARRTLDFINSSDLPGYLRDAVIDALTRAGMKTGFNTPDGYAEAGRGEIKVLAGLMAVTSGAFSLTRTPAEAFAFHLSEALALAKYHPDLIPVDAFNELGEAANTLVSDCLDFDSAEVFALALAGHARKVERTDEARRLVEGEGGAQE
jgi:hypothetical protein